ncbi:uncharacterized protein LACBIDRAFT_303123 [Laccaria bicolor S238N-H82]|uniref:Predicted protein n=1 Tax=Laccaria bicolor (strain S238N-H82 / ATCC MYA-4686) TaxID=486041 RepID=B0DIZ3_LACBS|nr:uncharacterized protein LACBIDRAFT_303123 [Laccaria bicolor S238N-H82]EDR05429.1 predicted protein [Laccaria bicolor S238N-H82]|eukprot:XP_001883987.1 predicted protein [Laccaria bicolor S238N-H82]
MKQSGLDDVDLVGDDCVTKQSEDPWSDAVFALGVKFQGLRRGWVSRPPQIRRLLRKDCRHRRHRRDHRPQLRHHRRPTTGVPRQSYPYKHLSLTPLKLSDLPPAAGPQRG